MSAVVSPRHTVDEMSFTELQPVNPCIRQGAKGAHRRAHSDSMHQPLLQLKLSDLEPELVALPGEHNAKTQPTRQTHADTPIRTTKPAKKSAAQNQRTQMGALRAPLAQMSVYL